ncbi:MAG: hypothetical protein E7167_01675 [Firmicutes bacterium]|nr:hypothetical protein [Bacillota bacterium]
MGVKPETLREAKKKLKELKDQGLTTEEAIARIQTTMDSIKPVHIVKTAEALTAFAAGLGSVAMLASSIKSAWDTLNNPEVSGLEKAISLMMTLSMMSSSIIGLANNIKTLTASELALNAAMKLRSNSEQKNAIA